MIVLPSVEDIQDIVEHINFQ